jgi:uncharacterized membrane protein YgdD (TMEM256/DUF423 family)
LNRGWAAAGAVSAGLAVAAGAFGAHALKARLGADALAVWETGARYQVVHALALFAVAGAARAWGGRLPHAAGALFVAGTLLFSGSLYVLALSGVRMLGAVAPFGGAALLAGWACLAWAALRPRQLPAASAAPGARSARRDRPDSS